MHVLYVQLRVLFVKLNFLVVNPFWGVVATFPPLIGANVSFDTGFNHNFVFRFHVRTGQPLFPRNVQLLHDMLLQGGVIQPPIIPPIQTFYVCKGWYLVQVYLHLCAAQDLIHLDLSNPARFEPHFMHHDHRIGNLDLHPTANIPRFPDVILWGSIFTTVA